MLTGIIQYSHELLKKVVKEKDIVIDATCGNGNDTLVLSELVGENGHVYAFDIQKQAIENTKTKLNQHNKKNVTYIHDSHAHLSSYIPKELEGKISACIFNL